MCKVTKREAIGVDNEYAYICEFLSNLARPHLAFVCIHLSFYSSFTLLSVSVSFLFFVFLPSFNQDLLDGPHMCATHFKCCAQPEKLPKNCRQERKNCCCLLFAHLMCPQTNFKSIRTIIEHTHSIAVKMLMLAFNMTILFVSNDQILIYYLLFYRAFEQFD